MIKGYIILIILSTFFLTPLFSQEPKEAIPHLQIFQTAINDTTEISASQKADCDSSRWWETILDYGVSPVTVFINGGEDYGLLVDVDMTRILGYDTDNNPYAVRIPFEQHHTHFGNTDFDQYGYCCFNQFYQIIYGNFINPQASLKEDLMIDWRFGDTPLGPYFYIPPLTGEEYEHCWMYIVKVKAIDEGPHVNLLAQGINLSPDYFHNPITFGELCLDEVTYFPNEFCFRNSPLGGVEPTSIEQVNLTVKNIGEMALPCKVMVRYQIGNYTTNYNPLTPVIEPNSSQTFNNICSLTLPHDANIVDGVIYGTLTITLRADWVFVLEDGSTITCPIYGENIINNQRTYNIIWRRQIYSSSPPDLSVLGLTFDDEIHPPGNNPHQIIYMNANDYNVATFKIKNNDLNFPAIDVNIEVELEKRIFSGDSYDECWTPLLSSDRYHISFEQHLSRIEPGETAEIHITMQKLRYIYLFSDYQRNKVFDPSNWRITTKFYYHWRQSSVSVPKAEYIEGRHSRKKEVIFLEQEKLENYGYPRDGGCTNTIDPNFYKNNNDENRANSTLGEFRNRNSTLHEGIDLPSCHTYDPKITFFVSKGYVARSTYQVLAKKSEGVGLFGYLHIMDYSIGDITLGNIINNTYRNSGVPIGVTYNTGINDINNPRCHLHFNDWDKDGNRLNPLRDRGIGNEGARPYDNEPPIISYFQLYNDSSFYRELASGDSNINLVDAISCPKMDLVIKCQDYMIPQDIDDQRPKAPYSIEYKLTNTDNGIIYNKRKIEFSTLTNIPVCIYSPRSDFVNHIFEYVLTNINDNGESGYINTSSLPIGNYNLVVTVKDLARNPVPVPHSVVQNYRIHLTNGAKQAPERINEDTDWNGNYRIDKNVVISSGATLTIKPGTNIYLSSGCTLILDNGNINAIGTADSTIVFAAVDDTAYWGGIRCTEDSTSTIFKYTRFINSKNLAETDTLGFHVTSSNKGGAIHLGNPDFALIENCEFTNCVADSGGVIFAGNGEISIINNKFFDSTALRGGAIFVGNGYTNIKGNYFTGNEAFEGSAVYFSNSDNTYFYNNTVLNNLSSDNRGALYLDNSHIDLLNNLLWQNGTGSQPIEVYINRINGDQSLNASLRSCDIQNGASSVFGPIGSSTLEDCISSDPKVVSGSEFGYILSSNSLCLNAGLAETDTLWLPTFDIAGNPRFDSASHIIDIGAYERPAQQTHITWTDDITEDTIWSADTVYVANTISVQDSTVLIIDPGVRVIISNEASIIVNGTLKTMGTSEQHVVFVPSNVPGSWGKVILNNPAVSYQLKRTNKIKVTTRPDQTTSNPKYSSFSEFQYTDFTSNPNSVPSDSLLGVVLEINDNYDAVFSNCNFTGTHRNMGGAVYLLNSFPQFEQCTFEDCSSTLGGAVYSAYSYPTFKQCSFIDNSATSGGAIYSYYSSQLMQNSVFAQNEATDGGSIYSEVSNLTSINNTVADNTAEQGGAYYLTNASILWAANSIVYSNVATTEGSQVYIDNTLAIDNPIYDGIGVAVDMAYCDVEGGSVAFGYSDTTYARGNQLLDNHLLVEKISKNSTKSRTEVTNTIDYDNSNISANPYLTNDYNITYNSPCLNTGSFENFNFNGYEINPELLGYAPIGDRYDIGFKELNIQASVDISGTITQNLSIFATTVRITGDLIIPAGVTVIIDSTTTSIQVMGNYQVNVGGNFYITGLSGTKLPIGTSGSTPWKGFTLSGQGILFLANCRVYNVQFTTKGAILCNNSTTLTVSNCEFYNNTTSQGKGGAISLGTVQQGSASIITIEDSYFHNNTALEGGALYLGYSTSVVVDNCKFQANTATSKGGAMVLGDSIMVRNCQVINNQATTGGGGIYFKGGNNLVLDCTIMDNSTEGYGGGLYYNPQPDPKEHSAVINTIVWNNTCPADTTKNVYGLSPIQDCTRYYAYSRIGSFAQCRYSYSMAVKDENPLVEWDSVSNLYKLKYYSPCIEGSTPLPHYVYGMNRSIFTEDIHRPLSGYFYDIGAVEYNNPPDLELTTPELSYGSVAIGDNLSRTLKLTNRSYYQPLQITDISLPSGFAFVGDVGRSNDNLNLNNRISNPVIDNSILAIPKQTKSKDTTRYVSGKINSNLIYDKKDSNKGRSTTFPIVVEALETVEIPIVFTPTATFDYTGNVTIESSASEESAVIRVIAQGYDDTQHIYHTLDWDADTVYVSTNIFVHHGGQLNIAHGTTVKYLKNRRITVDHGMFNLADSVRFTTSPNVTNAVIMMEVLENDQNRYIFNHTSFNNINIEACNCKGLVEWSDFTNSNLRHVNRFLEINHSAFSGSSVYAFCKEPTEEDIVRIIENSFNYTPYNSLISINSYPGFVIAENNMTNYQTALWINESGKGQEHVIENNTIENNQYGYGIELYHTTADIREANNINNNYIGIAGMRNSTITLDGIESGPYQTIHNNYDCELVFAEDSFPTHMTRNLIFDQLYPGYNLLRVTHHTGKEFKCAYNYWGPNFDPHTDLFPDGYLHFDPIWKLHEEVLEKFDAVEELYNSAKHNYEIGNYLMSYNQFKQVIEIAGPEHKDLAKASAEMLIGLAKLIQEPYSQLQQYYINEPHLHYDLEFTRLADYLANYCNIKLEDYPTAIAWFEGIISAPPTQIDSMYAVIDLAYTYLLMQDNSKYKGYVGKYPQFRFERFEDYLNMRENLIRDLLSMPESQLPHPVYSTTLDQNYPNPFNPVTTISFSLAKDSKCDLTIYNIKGQKVRSLLSDTKSKGKHRVIWDGKDQNGKGVSSGVYFYILSTDKTRMAKKMLLLK